MGRKKKYPTENDKYEAELRWKREWYKRNSDRIKKERMEKYWKNVEEKLSNM
jgi:uncharacterized protein YgiM (DUF1202 family)